MAMVVQLHEGVAIKKFKLDKPTLTLGRDPENDIFIDNSVVSSKHAIITVEPQPESTGGAQYVIEDLNSTNSTYVNGEKITRHKLAHDDVIRIGWNNFKFIDDAQADPNQTAKIKKSWIPGVYYTEDE
ncbi:MAG: FHA domain-containing protein [Desulfobacterales bacterium]|jgi:pSer/pThr/pTyr-binding forkhead associated (FHA) protein